MPSGPATASALIPDDVLAAVRTTVDAINGTADGAVGDQQKVLDGLIDAGQTQIQDRCPAPTSTLALEPAWPSLAPAPRWQPGEGSMSAAVYSLPSLLRVYRSGRLVGTDIADLHFSVTGGKARLAALCVA